MIGLLLQAGLSAFMIIYIIRLRRALGKSALSFSGPWDAGASVLMIIGGIGVLVIAVSAFAVFLAK